MTLSARSMAALWLAGFEDVPGQERCGELCVVEVFGSSVKPGSAEVGRGIKAFRVRRCPGPPTYPMQLMVAVFDLPEWTVGGDDHLVPSLAVDRIAG